ncbi:hypothetical protein ASPVEDRAFT_121997 [Aspergillus versicolor CBS 583.65]|uniref:Uncharacterized protein n=1 Tax=Aspergillus versicolor CBS 583.65 TaxID=1036611 RepID=A0A1L9P6H5_ASPVE|nr:uncharacterized protein ASPVEDRAFT_121997 [Aspergillus versicolor CBS 583.65]OJI97127.1 hypothetical protein ASPVEDRAFT_121997 [Aspergillus versicolor CBS 583.65]
MDSSNLGSPALPGNRLIAYIRSLAEAKKGLPYGLPVCVAPSHTVTSTDALLRLASLVGPYISVLQVHADVIDDWSEDTIRQLTLLAKKYAFLIWEGGRILNSTIGVVGRQKAESREVRNVLVDLIRKKYTKGVVKPASWANVSTAWASGIPIDNQAADILIPTLKAAAREAVADAVQTIRTEITVDSASDRPSHAHSSSTVEPNGTLNHQRLPSNYAVEESSSSNSLELPPRKASTISLTQTITQHTEDSSDALNEAEAEEVWDFGAAPPPATDAELPSPPSLARGVVLCLPSCTDTVFNPEYRKSCMAAAYANQDFVLGFVCGEPWHIVSQNDEEILDIDALTGVSTLNEKPRRSHNLDEAHDTPPQSAALFSMMPHKLSSQNEQQLVGTPSEASELPPDDLNPLAYRLYSLVRQGVRARDAVASQRAAATSQQGTKASSRRPNIIHIPVVSLP